MPSQTLKNCPTEHYNSPDLVDHVDAGPTAIYCGVDPTASSLHLGNLVTLLGLLHFHIKGHTTIGLVKMKNETRKKLPLSKKMHESFRCMDRDLRILKKEI